MKKLVFLQAIFIFLYLNGLAQKVEVIKAGQLYNMIEECQQDLCVYNFWATWCAPCIRELPEFEKLSQENNNVKVRLISMDDVDDLNGSVKLFIQKRNIKSDVMLLDETDFNEIIPRIDDTWSGAIPATLIIDRRGKRYFYEKEFKEGELYKTIESLSNNQN